MKKFSLIVALGALAGFVASAEAAQSPLGTTGRSSEYRPAARAVQAEARGYALTGQKVQSHKASQAVHQWGSNRMQPRPN